MPEEEKPSVSLPSAEPRVDRSSGDPRNGKSHVHGSRQLPSVSLQEIFERILQGLIVVLLCVGAWLYLSPSTSNSGQFKDFVPAALAAAMYFVMNAWPSVSGDQSTIIGLVLVLVGAWFWYVGAQSDATNLAQKSDLQELGTGLIGAGVGVFVGQRLPRSTKRDGVDDEQI